MSAAPFVVLAAESESSLPNHWVVGAVVLLILVAAMVGLLAFGAGRDHT